jgi:DNA-binding transcriptional LysR family regulator
MDWRAIDLNLLVVFQAVMDHRGVTRAGESLGLSQPAMSASLARLRELFQDPLFVRSGTEMKPTTRAVELAMPIRRVLESIRTDVFQRTEFRPSSTAKTFSIITPDVGEVTLIPPLRARLAVQAPGAMLRVFSRPPVATAAALESGEADLAIGYFPDLQKAGFYQQKLADIPLIGLVRADHPDIGSRLTLEQYVAASHVMVRPDGRGQERVPFPKDARPRIALELAHFMSVLPVVETSDLIAAVPLDIADVCTRYARVRVVELPPESSPPIPVHQFWHARFHKDAAHIWLRGVVKAMYHEGGPVVPVR